MSFVIENSKLVTFKLTGSSKATTMSRALMKSIAGAAVLLKAASALPRA